MRYTFAFGVITVIIALLLTFGWGVEEDLAIVEAGVLSGFFITINLLDDILKEIKKGSENR